VTHALLSLHTGRARRRAAIPSRSPCLRVSVASFSGWALSTLILSGNTLALAAPPLTPPPFDADQVRRILKHSPVPPLPPDETNAVADDPEAARLGQALFFERRLSADGRVACATCHVPERSWSDGLDLSHGLALGRRNTPALWNVAYNRWFFWDGRADTVWSQALKPIESPTEMGGNRSAAVQLVRGDQALRAAYESVFGPLADSGSDITGPNRAFANLGKALAAFERRIVSRRAPFDIFVEGLREGDGGKQAALSPAARRGLALFVGRGNCSVCHAGPLFTDGEFHDLGIPPNDSVELPDPGRLAGVRQLLQDEFGASGLYSDDRQGPRALALRHLAPRLEIGGQMKTPSLRNVALTAPYMHQGQFASLRAVLRFYSTHEGRRGLPAQQERILQPLHLSDAETDDLVAFLESLTDAQLDPLLAHPSRLDLDRTRP
jgi:cytochrome c peroxidase